MSTFHLKIIAYDKIFYDDEAASVVLPAIDGEVQILTNHEECVVALKTGEVRIGTPKGEMIPAVCGSGLQKLLLIIRWKFWWIRSNARRKSIYVVRKRQKSVQKNGYCSIRAGWNIIVIPHRWQERWHVWKKQINIATRCGEKNKLKMKSRQTRKEAGYAHFGNENHPIVLSWISFSVLFHLHGGSSRACT